MRSCEFRTFLTIVIMKKSFQIICVHWSGAQDTILSCLESMRAFLLENWYFGVRNILTEFEGVLFIQPNAPSNSEEEQTRLSVFTNCVSESFYPPTLNTACVKRITMRWVESVNVIDTYSIRCVNLNYYTRVEFL